LFSLSNILANLGDTDSSFDEGTGSFQHVNIENAKKNLELPARSRENGKAGIPVQDSKNKDGMAVEIDSYITEIVSLAKDKLVDRLHTMQALSGNQIVDVRKEILAIFENGKNELFVSAKDFYSDMFDLRRKWISGEAEFSEFRKIHRRVGPARHPERAARTNSIGIILLFFGLEIAMNAYTLGITHRDGPVGVIMEIFLFGVINLGVATLLGYYVWGFFKHAKILWRGVAVFLAVPMMAFLLFLNAFMGHYRDALAKSAVTITDLSIKALQTQVQLASEGVGTLLTNPIMLEDFKSYMIVGFGLIAAIVVLIKSYGLDEPYPGYGKISREQELLARNFNDKQAALLREINDMADNYVAEINEKISILDGNSAALKFRSDDQERLLEKYKNWLASAESAGKALYAYYREENLKSRESKSEPLPFSEHQFELPDIAKHVPSARALEKFDDEDIKYKSAEMAEKLYSDLHYYQGKFKDLTNLSPDHKLQDNFTDSDFSRPN
jgi:hypothetical protein